MIHAIALALASILYVPPAVGPNLDLSLQAGVCGPSNLSRQALAARAVAGMGKLGFRYAGPTPDGHAYGYSDAVTVVVLMFALPDGRSCPMICRAGSTGGDVERVKHALHAHLLNGPDDPAAPREVGTLVPQAFRKSPPLRWQTATRPATELLGPYVNPALGLALAKNGLGVTSAKTNMAVGSGGSGRVAVNFLMPGPNAVSGTFACVVTAPDENDADRGCRIVLAEVLKILFE
jgi:hypothetical protein